MSRAFVREPDGDTPPEPPAETPVSPHRNLVTPRGLALLQAELARLDAVLARPEADDAPDRARVARDRRYFARRLASAEPVAPHADGEGEPTVTFGYAVTLALPGERRVTWRIVGEDEADPSRGRIAWTSPVAGLLTGLGVGDEVVLPAGAAEVVAINTAAEPLPDPSTGDPA